MDVETQPPPGAPTRRAAGFFLSAIRRLGPLTATFFAVVVVAAGASGGALLAAPSSPGRYFSWALRPPAAASLIGGLYLASAVLFAWALSLPWRQARPLVVGALGLAVPTLVLTFVHHEVFHFAHWQAGAWVVLFVTAPLAAVAILVRPPSDVSAGSVLGPGGRFTLALVAVALAALALLVWLDATRDWVARYSPVGLVGLTGAYLGSWSSFLAVLSGWAAVRGRWDDARLPLVALSLASVATLGAFLRSLDDLRHPVPALAVPTALLLVSGGTYAAAATTGQGPSRRVRR